MNNFRLQVDCVLHTAPPGCYIAAITDFTEMGTSIDCARFFGPFQTQLVQFVWSTLNPSSETHTLSPTTKAHFCFLLVATNAR
jgi:hypothetical protein